MRRPRSASTLISSTCSFLWLCVLISFALVAGDHANGKTVRWPTQSQYKCEAETECDVETDRTRRYEWTRETGYTYRRGAVCHVFGNDFPVNPRRTPQRRTRGTNGTEMLAIRFCIFLPGRADGITRQDDAYKALRTRPDDTYTGNTDGDRKNFFTMMSRQAS